MTADVTQIPTKSSQGAEWKLWYDALKSEFGIPVANQLFMKAWQTRGSSDANTHDLRTELEKYGVDINKGVLSSIYDEGASIADKIGGFLNIGKDFVYIIGGVVLLGFAGMVFQLVRKPETIGTIAKAAAV